MYFFSVYEHIKNLLAFLLPVWFALFGVVRFGSVRFGLPFGMILTLNRVSQREAEGRGQKETEQLAKSGLMPFSGATSCS